ncbi:Sec-independent protein translocase protein TatB [Nitrincola sp.]|uniref:Sec-independent protein translocase protein TatB n=1 Tax=Nitrincola sp. TaxID=1926584 RepID=UPI003A8CF5B5
MFDIGFLELLVIGVVALLVLGPERLPHAARTCGLLLGRVRRSFSSIQSEIRDELRAEEPRRTTATDRRAPKKEMGEVNHVLQQQPAAENYQPNKTSKRLSDPHGSIGCTDNGET